jgi:hypothetical protein
MEIEIFRRQRGSSGQWKSRTRPLIKLEMPRGQFVVFKNAMDMMGFRHNEAVMFGFNRKEQCGYIFKEEPEDDSYYLRDNGRNYARFTSKDLMLHVCEVFEIKDVNTAYFVLDKEPNKKGMYRFTYEP